MKRFLLSLICCSPLLLSPSVSFSVDLTGPSEESPLSFEQYGPINPSETLWAISSKLRPDNTVSVQQTLVAIYKTNPYAFYNGNINKIIPESIISIPSLAFVRQQTNGEAAQLIQQFTAKAKPTPKPITPPKAAEVEVAEIIEEPVVISEPIEIDAEIIAENELNKERALAAELKLQQMQDEVDILNEQFIVATESTQVLKLKLQPLNDKISTLSEQLEAELAVQVELQKIIDEYRAKLEAIEPAPFSGDGMLNNILKVITSSLTNLLIVIISPIILLLLLFVVISRIRSKRELAEQEKELAESTAILMEESGQFDALLTDDIDETESEEMVDFSNTEVNPIPQEDSDVIIPDELEAIDLTEDLDSDVVDLTLDDELITEVDLDETASESDADDPFGMSALSEAEAMPAVDLSDDETETNEDDPFGISALADDELLSAVDLSDDELETSEDDPFGIGALTDQIEEATEEEAATISDAEQADLDLAAQWEAQVSADSQSNTDEDLSMSSSDIDDLLASDAIESEQVNPEPLAPTDEVTPEVALDAEQPSLDDDLFDVSSLESEAASDSIEEQERADDLTDIDNIELPTTEQAGAEVDIFDADDLDALEEALTVETEASTSEDAELPESEDEQTLVSNETSEDTDEDLFSLDMQTDEEELPSIDADTDLLAQQISDVAFNEEVALPEVGDASEDDFIDIETLLENSGPVDKDEPYSELDLDLGLDEFPDVVELQENVDIDDDENGIGAQLDLARAYLEIDDKEGAKEILMAVVDDSNGKQREEIDKLLSRLS